MMRELAAEMIRGEFSIDQMMILIDAPATGNEDRPSIGKFHSRSKELANATIPTKTDYYKYQQGCMF
jgi:hypothetical protein